MKKLITLFLVLGITGCSFLFPKKVPRSLVGSDSGDDRHRPQTGRHRAQDRPERAVPDRRENRHRPGGLALTGRQGGPHAGKHPGEAARPRAVHRLCPG